MARGRPHTPPPRAPSAVAMTSSWSTPGHTAETVKPSGRSTAEPAANIETCQHTRMWEFFVTSLLLMCACVLAAAGPCPEWTETAMQPKAHPDNPSASRYQCEARAGVGGVPDQCCCGPLMNGTWHCLPRVIIAGAQKSGSTALYGYLTLHPNFSPARRKELHAFEAASRWRDKPVALMSYLLSFQAHDPAKVRGVGRRRGCGVPAWVCVWGCVRVFGFRAVSDCVFVRLMYFLV